MKKIISLILAATMLLAMSICLFSCDDETETTPKTYTVTVVDDNGNPVKDVVITFTPESGEFSMKVTKDEGKVTYEPAEKFTASITSVPKGYKNDAVGKTLNSDEQGNVTVVINKEVTQVTKEDYVILVVDQDGNTIVPFEYEQIVPINFTTELRQVGCLGVAKTGYTNENLEFYVKKSGSWSAISAK